MPKSIGRTTIAAYRQQSGKLEERIKQLKQQLFDEEKKGSELGERFFQRLQERLGGKSEALDALKDWHTRTGNCPYHVAYENSLRGSDEPIRCRVCNRKIWYDRRD